jgi:flavin reductase (DIM6/NTAB) family NADH-FMN oxidoreductase RutF
MLREDIEKSQEYFTTTVALVTSELAEKVNVMSAEWSLRVSLEPFLMAVFVGYERGTYRMIKESGEFGLSYCSDRQGHLAHVAGNYSVNDVDKFKLAIFTTIKSKYIRAPLIDGAISCFECRVIDEFKVGDHAAFIGEVLTAYYDPEAGPLVFHNGKFWKRGERLGKGPWAE